MKPVIIATILFLLAGLPEEVSAQAGSLESGLKLSEAIDRSLENATSVRLAQADRAMAESNSGILSSDYIPRISGSVSYTLSQYPQIITPIRQQGAFPPLDDEIYEATLQADWEIFDFGEGRAARKAALAFAEAADIRYELSRLESIEAVASRFVQVQQLRELKRVQIQRIEALHESKGRLQTLYEEGRIAEIDLMKIEDTIIDAETDVLETGHRMERILQVLADDLGLEEPLKAADIEPLQLDNNPSFNPGAVPNGEVPLIVAARQKWVAAKHEVTASSRGFLPQLNLFAAEQFRTGSSFEIDDQWVAGIRLNVPLFAGQKFVGNQVKKLQAKSRRIELEQIELTYLQHLNSLTNSQFEAHKKVQAAEARLQYLRETFRVEQVSHREGKTTLTDLLLTESKLNGVRAELIAERSRLRIINLTIAALTGQLTKELAVKLAKGEPL